MLTNVLTIKKYINNKMNYLIYILIESIKNLYFLYQTFLICFEYGILHIINYDSQLCFNHFINQLAELNIFYVKIFQSICTNNFILNNEQIEYLYNFTDEVPFTSNDIDPLIEYNIKQTAKQENHIISLDKQGENLFPYKSGAVSLVYKGKLNNEEIVVKVLRKNIKQKLTNALNRIDFVCKIIGKFPYLYTLNLSQLVEENKDMLLSQVNFANEVTNIQEMYKNCLHTDYVKIPMVYPEYTNNNNNIIVMEKINGCKLNELNIDDKEIYCDVLAKFSIKCILYNRLYHADLHPGNILFLKENDKYIIGIIDYGIMGHLTKDEQNYYFNLLKTLSTTTDYQDVIDIVLKGLVEPKNTVTQLNKLEYNKLRVELSYILNEELTISGPNNIRGPNNITGADVFKINSKLRKHNLFLSKNFCKVQLCMAISDSVIRKLSDKTTYMNNIKNNMLLLFGGIDIIK